MNGRNWIRGRMLVLGVGVSIIPLVATLALATWRGVGGSDVVVTDARFEIASDFTLPTFDGGSVTLSDYSNGPVFIYFWASWCLPCRLEAPMIQRLWPEYEADGYTFIGINILDSNRDASEFIEEFGLSFHSVSDDEGDVYLEYGVYGLPEAFFLRPGLIVSRKLIGELSEQEFREILEHLRLAS